MNSRSAVPKPCLNGRSACLTRRYLRGHEDLRFGCRGRIVQLPATHGRPPLEKFLMARFARQKNYRLQKQLRAVSANVIVCSWDAEWDDGQDGRQMQGRGIELLTMRGDEIAKWESYFQRLAAAADHRCRSSSAQARFRAPAPISASPSAPARTRRWYDRAAAASPRHNAPPMRRDRCLRPAYPAWPRVRNRSRSKDCRGRHGACQP